MDICYGAINMCARRLIPFSLTTTTAATRRSKIGVEGKVLIDLRREAPESFR
jgi:hypothetical protein